MPGWIPSSPGISAYEQQLAQQAQQRQAAQAAQAAGQAKVDGANAYASLPMQGMSSSSSTIPSTSYTTSDILRDPYSAMPGLKAIRDSYNTVNTNPTPWENKYLTDALTYGNTAANLAEGGINSGYGGALRNINDIAARMRGSAAGNGAAAASGYKQAAHQVLSELAAAKAATGAPIEGMGALAPSQLQAHGDAQSALAQALTTSAADSMRRAAGGQWGLGAEAGAQMAELGRQQNQYNMLAQMNFDKMLSDRINSQTSANSQAKMNLDDRLVMQLGRMYAAGGGGQSSSVPVTGTKLDQLLHTAAMQNAYKSNGANYTPDVNAAMSIFGGDLASGNSNGVPDVGNFLQGWQAMQASGSLNPTHLSALGLPSDPASWWTLAHQAG